jgi:hypothetical protein
MSESIARWILTLANSACDRKGKTGRLKVYTVRTQVPSDGSCIALDRIVEHLAHADARIDRPSVVAAIGSLLPKAGSGQRVHVVITSDERARYDATVKAFNTSNAKSTQTENRNTFLRAAAMDAIESLPVFISPAVEVLDVTVQ